MCSVVPLALVACLIVCLGDRIVGSHICSFCCIPLLVDSWCMFAHHVFVGSFVFCLLFVLRSIVGLVRWLVSFCALLAARLFV